MYVHTYVCTYTDTYIHIYLFNKYLSTSTVLRWLFGTEQKYENLCPHDAYIKIGGRMERKG